jgi:hypothetical protein
MDCSFEQRKEQRKCFVVDITVVKINICDG